MNQLNISENKSKRFVELSSEREYDIDASPVRAKAIVGTINNKI
jgi:hypothetical protein